MLVDLRKNPSSGHLAATRIKYREVRCTQIVHKKRHFLPIRYFQERLKIAMFSLVESVNCDRRWELTRRENTEVKPLRNLQTVAIFVFLLQQWLSVYKPAPDPLVLKKMPWINLFSRAKIKPDREDLHSISLQLFFQVQEIALFMTIYVHRTSLYLMRVRASWPLEKLFLKSTSIWHGFNTPYFCNASGS